MVEQCLPFVSQPIRVGRLAQCDGTDQEQRDAARASEVAQGVEAAPDDPVETVVGEVLAVVGQPPGHLVVVVSVVAIDGAACLGERLAMAGLPVGDRGELDVRHPGDVAGRDQRAGRIGRGVNVCHGNHPSWSCMDRYRCGRGFFRPWPGRWRMPAWPGGARCRRHGTGRC